MHNTYISCAFLSVAAAAAVPVESAMAAEPGYSVTTTAFGGANAPIMDHSCGGGGNVTASLCQGQTGTPGLNSTSSSIVNPEFSGLVVNTANAAADLATGQLHAYASETGPIAGGGSHAQAGFSDTLHFNVGSATGLIAIPVSFTIHGSLGGDGTPQTGPYGQASFQFALSDSTFSSVVSEVQADYLSSSPVDISQALQSVTYTGVWSQSPTNPNKFIGTYLLDAAHPNLEFFAYLDAYASNGGFNFGSFADLGHTASVAFDLPEGVTFTSDSGVFLTQAPPGDDGVPEPSTWAMMLGGFCVTGLMRRRWAKRYGTRAASI